MHPMAKVCRSYQGYITNEKGFSLVEVIISIALLSLVAVALLVALQTAITVTHLANVRTEAVSLADSQIEAIKAGPYFVSQNGTANYVSMIPLIPSGFRFSTVDGNSNTVNCTIYGIPWDIINNVRWTNTTPSDPGIQKVTLIVESDRLTNSRGVYREVFRLVDFKVNR